MRIGLGTHFKQQPFLEFNPSTRRFQLWTSFNADCSSGSYLDLYRDGLVELVTVEKGYVIDITIISTGVVEERSNRSNDDLFVQSLKKHLKTT